MLHSEKARTARACGKTKVGRWSVSTASDFYTAIAEWYDIEHDALTEDAECFLSLLALPTSGRARILDVGSGTGRIAVALAVGGHEVTCVEPSEAMRTRCASRLARLPERVARRVTVLPGSATALGLDTEQRFDTAVLGLHLLGHLATASERHSALTGIGRQLVSGGQMLVDVDLLGPRRLYETARQMWWQGTWQLSETGEELSHFVTGVSGPTSGMLEVVHFYDFTSQNGEMRRTTARMSLALLSRGEVEVALMRAGYGIEAIYGGYDLIPYDDGSPRAIFDARLMAGK